MLTLVFTFVVIWEETSSARLCTLASKEPWSAVHVNIS